MDPSVLFDPRPVSLQHNGVRLEPLEVAHRQDLFRYGQDPSIWRYMKTPAFSSEADAVKWIEEAVALSERGDAVAFAIVNEQDGRCMGTTRFLDIRRADRGMEIGFTWLGLPYQRTHVNSTVKYLLLRHAFDELAALRVHFKTDARNQASRNALLRLGARQEGIFTRHMLMHDGHVRDSVYFAITDLDWPQVRDGLLQRLSRSPVKLQ